jgi:hydroxyacylglutathione hydrolase
MKDVDQLDENLYQINTHLTYVEEEDILKVHIRSFLITAREGAVLIDAGGIGTGEQVLQLLDELHLDPSDLRMLLLTHAHADHAGAAKKLVDMTGCLVAVHRYGARPLRDISLMYWDFMQSFPEQFPTSGKMERMYHAIIDDPVNPDIQFAGNHFKVDLGDVALIAKAAPGHSFDSTCFYEPNRRWLFTGDSLHGGGLEVEPPCYRSVPMYLDTLERISKLPVDRLFAAHFAPMEGQEVRDLFDLSFKSVDRIDKVVRDTLKAASRPLEIADIGKAIAEDLQKAFTIQALFTAKAHLEYLEGIGVVAKYGSEAAKYCYLGMER